MWSFLLFLFLVGILFASLQDLKRREVDNILNFSLLVIGCAYVCLQSILERDLILFSMLIFSLIIVYGAANLFYYGRVFAGGDAKLLIALSSIFAASSLNLITSFKLTLVNIGIFLLFLMISGAFYGLVYAFFLFFRSFSKTRKEFKIQIKKVYFPYFLALAIILLGLTYFDSVFIIFPLLVLTLPIIYAFGRSIENVALIKDVKVSDLTEGDWILGDLKIKGKTIKGNWEGLTKKELELLNKFAKNRKVCVKEGIPFVPAFLIAFLIYAFRDYFISLIFSWI